MSKSKNAVIGTAGHVDHGKTALIKALTGIDTDRLAEEKKRGITIETGYAHLDLPSGIRAGVVDVPGHERFIKNMLAGATGIDLAMLVVAADDGVMPQTREHFEILRFLDIPSGLVVITKADLVEDADWSELVRDDISRLIEGSFLEGAPILTVSAHTGQGLEELKATLAQLVASLKPHEGGNFFRLPLDRLFVLTGFGTVATGTLMEGKLSLKDTVLLYPAETPVKIRGIQVHGQAVEIALPGQRVAVNLNLKKDKLERGDILANLGSLVPTLMLDVRLTVLKNTSFPVKNGSWVHLYLGAREQLAKVILMDVDELEAGQTGFAQLRFLEPLAGKKGDRFVIRFYSPVVTIGGGEILDPVPLKRRRHKAQVLSHFEIKESGSPLEQLELAVDERPDTFASLQELVIRAGLDPVRVKGDCNVLVQQKRLVALTKDVYIHQRTKEKLCAELKTILEGWHKNNPYSPGLSLEEGRNRLAPTAPPAVVDAFFEILEKEKFMVREQSDIRLFSFKPQVNEAENELIGKLDQLYLSYGMTPLITSAVEPSSTPAEERRRQGAFSALIRQGLLKRLDDSYHIHAMYYEQAVKRFKELAANKATVVAGQFRDELGTSRKVAVSLLEYFDRLDLTRPAGEGRTLR